MLPEFARMNDINIFMKGEKVNYKRQRKN